MTSPILLTHAPAARALYYGDAELGLRKIGDIILHEDDLPLAGNALVDAAARCDIIVADRATAFPGDVLSRLPGLVAVVRCAVDIRNIDVAAASALGILVTQASPGFVASVAELAIGFMIDCARGITDATGAYRAGKVPSSTMGRQIRGSTLGIIGYGQIGRYLAAAARGLGMHVLIHDPYVDPKGVDPTEDVESPGLDLLLSRSDFVAPLAVATEETENLIDERALSLMKRTAFLINLSRGNLVDEAALARALADGRIAGAAMDVGRATDQMPSPGLARLPGVIVTPHIGGLVREAVAHQAQETVRQAAGIAHGTVPTGAVNAEAATRLWRLAPG